MYDARKNKVVNYFTKGFPIALAKSIVDQHRQSKNLKFEQYNNKDYEYFVVNNSVNEEVNPGKIYKYAHLAHKHLEGNFKELEDINNKIK